MMEAEYRVCYSDDCLEHHGVQGQKWGVRRYQNSDGSLTELGKRRRIRSQNKKACIDSVKKKIEATRTKVEEKRSKIEKANSKIDIKSLSDDELRRMTNRMQLEANFMNAQLARYPVKPKTKSFVKRSIEKMANASVDALSGAIREVGKDYIKKEINKKIKQSEKTRLDYLKSLDGGNNKKKNTNKGKK